MGNTLDSRRLRRLDIQGFDGVDERYLAEVAPWLRLAFATCASLATMGTLFASVPLLLMLSGIALVAALSPVHPFDLAYNHVIRRWTRTPPLPRRGAPVRFACGIGSAWLLATVAAFQWGPAPMGYALGSALVGSAVLVSSTDICIPSMVFRFLFGAPRPRPGRTSDSRAGAEAYGTVAR